MPGSITSRTTSCGSAVSISLRAVSPSPASSVVNPSRRRYRTTTSRTIGSSSTTRTVGILLLWLPLAVMALGPVLADRSDGDSPQSVARRRMNHGQVQIADQEDDGDVHQPVVEDDRTGEAETGVALAQPEQHARHEEQER